MFLGAVAAGTILGGPIGDRFGRKKVIWGSIFGVFPFALWLPYANLFWTSILSVLIGLILASAFSAIVVYAQELVPGRVGLISGVFFGFAFGMGGLGAAVLGQLADVIGIESVYHICAFLPLIGLLAAFLPNLDKPLHTSRTRGMSVRGTRCRSRWHRACSREGNCARSALCGTAKLPTTTDGGRQDCPPASPCYRNRDIADRSVRILGASRQSALKLRLSDFSDCGP